MSNAFSCDDGPLCVVGNINRDVKVLGVPAGPGLLSDGETSVNAIVETIGGGGANSACAAAALGASVRFVGKVGDDPLADRLARALDHHGVRPYLARDARQPTGTTVALGLSDGHRHFLSCLPNNRSLTFDDLDLAALDGCGHLLRADVWFSDAMLEDGNRRLFQAARDRGLATSLDINFDPAWSCEAPAVIARRKGRLATVLDLVDLAHGNVSELCRFTDSPNLETALGRLLDRGVGAVVVHLGARGAGYFSAAGWLVEPPCPAGNPVHATGTGDVLSACMILLHGREDLSTAEKLRMANRVVCQYMEGALALIPAI